MIVRTSNSKLFENRNYLAILRKITDIKPKTHSEYKLASAVFRSAVLEFMYDFADTLYAAENFKQIFKKFKDIVTVAKLALDGEDLYSFNHTFQNIGDIIKPFKSLFTELIKRSDTVEHARSYIENLKLVSNFLGQSELLTQPEAVKKPMANGVAEGVLLNLVLNKIDEQISGLLDCEIIDLPSSIKMIKKQSSALSVINGLNVELLKAYVDESLKYPTLMVAEREILRLSVELDSKIALGLNPEDLAKEYVPSFVKALQFVKRLKPDDALPCIVRIKSLFADSNSSKDLTKVLSQLNNFNLL